MPVTQDQGMEMLGILCAKLHEELVEVAPALDFAVVFWNRGRNDDPLSVALFSPPVTQPQAPVAALTAAFATLAADGGLDVARVDQLWAEIRAKLIGSRGPAQ